MTDVPQYRYPPDKCDVQDQGALKSFRDKRAEWLIWLDHDEHHPISSVISSMVWTDVSFRALAKAGEMEPAGCLSNSLIAEALISGHFATQTLAIRRLTDGRKDVISLVRLLRDVGENIHLFTRENFVSFDGLPYDYEAAKLRVRKADVGQQGPFWRARTGPDAFAISEAAHREFDRLSGTTPDKRNRTDRISKSYIDGLQQWLTDSDADDIVKWTHKFLAHAADPKSRSKIDMMVVRLNLEKITAVIRCYVRISEAVHALFLSAHGDAMPVAQFDQFEHLDAPLLSDAHQSDIHALWNALTDERNSFGKGALDELLGSANGPAESDATDKAKEGPSIWDAMHDPEWLADPQGKAEREIELCLQEFREKA